VFAAVAEAAFQKQGGHQQQVGPGDVILIPAGVAHHWLKIDQPVVYLDTKFPKAE